MYSAIAGARPPLQLRPREGRQPDRLREGLQEGGQAGPGRGDRQGVRVREGRVRLHDRRGLRGGAGRGLHARSRSRDFVPYDDIDPIYFEKTYYLGPQDGAEKVYALLLKAMDRVGPRRRSRSTSCGTAQHLGCLRVRDGVITLEQHVLRRRDPAARRDQAEEGLRVSKEELAMADAADRPFGGTCKPESTRTPTATRSRDHQAQAQGRGGPRRAGAGARGGAGPDGRPAREPRGVRGPLALERQAPRRSSWRACRSRSCTSRQRRPTSPVARRCQRTS